MTSPLSGTDRRVVLNRPQRQISKLAADA